MRVFELDVFVAEKRPGGEEGAIKSQGATKIEGRLFVLRRKGIVIADDAVGFRPERVDGRSEVRKVGESRILRSHVEDVRIDIEGVEAVWSECEDGVKGGLGGIVVCIC